MHKPTKISAAILALVAVGWLAVVPGIVGMRAEEEMKKIAQNSSEQGSLPIKTQLISFQRGWFSSEAKTDYVVMLGTIPMHFMVEHHINQIAIPFYRWAKISHTINVVSDDGKESTLPFNVIASSDRLFFGGYSTLISAPTIHWENADGIGVMGSNLSLKLVGSIDHPIDYEASIPSLSVTTASDMFKFNLTNLSTSGHNSADQSPTARWEQHAHFALEAIDASQNGADVFSMHNIDLNADLNDNDKMIDVIYKTKIASTSIGNPKQATAGAPAFAAQDIKVDFSYVNLNKEALLNLKKAIQELNKESLRNAGNADAANSAAQAALDPLQNQQQQLAQANQLLQKSGDLIRSSPSIRLDQFSMKTAEGNISGKAEFNVDGKNFNAQEISITNIGELLKSRISAKASLNVGRNVFIQGFEDKAGDLNQQRQMKEGMLKAWVQQAYVKDNGTDLSLESTYSAQGLMVNGKQIM